MENDIYGTSIDSFVRTRQERNSYGKDDVLGYKREQPRDM